MSDSCDWAIEMLSMQDLGENAREALDAVVHVLDEADTVRDALKSPAFQTLHQSINSIRKLASCAEERYRRGPLRTFVAGKKLSPEEYYVLRAQGVSVGSCRELGLIAFDDYDVHEMLCYENDSKWTYINVGEKPRDPALTKVGCRIGCSPEECSLKSLRPEQEAFFREYLPHVYERFADDD